jgi:hypothetical protein
MDAAICSKRLGVFFYPNAEMAFRLDWIVVITEAE